MVQGSKQIEEPWLCKCSALVCACYISSIDRTVSDHLFPVSFVSVMLEIETIYQEYAENSYNVLVW